MDDLHEPLLLRNIRQDEWVNPFGASAPEILAATLEESGLLLKNTVINDQPAQQFYQSYCQKRSRINQPWRVADSGGLHYPGTDDVGFDCADDHNTILIRYFGGNGAGFTGTN